MKLAIVGSRTITNYESFKRLLFDLAISHNLFDIEIITGGAKGVDSMAERFAIENEIPYKIFYPNWDRYGKKAGFLRNKEIVDYCDKLIAIWDGKSKGTKHSIDLAIKQNKLTLVVRKDLNGT